MGDYLQSIPLYIDYEKEADHASVKLMTIHTAKGSNTLMSSSLASMTAFFPTRVPCRKARNKPLRRIPRLVYVAMTETEGINPGGKRKIPSRFIFEIKENLFDRIGIIEESFYKESLNQIEYIKVTVLGESPPDGFQLNDQVEHLVFDKCSVTEVDARSWTYVMKFGGMAILKPISFEFKRMIKTKSD